MMRVTMLNRPFDPDGLCARAAAICTNSPNWAKALEHALSSGHDSVAEHASFTFRIEGVSRALLAQITRHRIASFSVKSQRYVSMNEMPYVVPPTIRKDPAVFAKYQHLMSHINDFYNLAVASGIPKEDARFITPQAAFTDLIVTMNARELRHFFSLRCCNRAQWEIRQLADEMLALCKENAPMLFADAGPGCVRGRCPEKRPCGNPKK